jgi:hypothetical protein
MALAADAMEVAGNVEFVGALPDIRAKGDITINVKDPRGRLNVQATGNITVNQTVGKTSAVIKLGQVVAATFNPDNSPKTVGNIAINALHGIDGTTFSSRVFGAQVLLDGGAGSVMARIDSAAMGSGGVAARAQGAINLVETDGDMRLILPQAWKGETVSVRSANADVKLESRWGAIVDASYERFTADPAEVAARIAAAGFSETELRLAGMPTGQALVAQSKYPVSPELLAAIFPHRDLGGTQVGTGAERINVQGRNVTLVSQSAEGGIGRSTERVTVTNLDSPEQNDDLRAVLSKASARDVVSVQYQRYEWMGETTTFDLSSVGSYVVDGWRLVDGTETLPATMQILASIDGVQSVTQGQWVENRHEVISVVLQVWDDVNISATGDVAVNSSGDVVLTAAGDLRVRDLLDLELSGITAGGRMRLEAAGSILTQGSDQRIDAAGGVAVLRSAGDMLLVASGTAGVTGGVIRSNAGTLSINVGAYGQKLPGNDGWRDGTLTIRAAGDVHVTEWTDNLLLSSVSTKSGHQALQVLQGFSLI